MPKGPEKDLGRWTPCAEPTQRTAHICSLVGWNARLHNWVMVGYGSELLEYCRRERFPGGLWDN